jgi:hypothetical protein
MTHLLKTVSDALHRLTLPLRFLLPLLHADVQLALLCLKQPPGQLRCYRAEGRQGPTDMICGEALNPATNDMMNFDNFWFTRVYAQVIYDWPNTFAKSLKRFH